MIVVLDSNAGAVEEDEYDDSPVEGLGLDHAPDEELDAPLLPPILVELRALLRFVTIDSNT